MTKLRAAASTNTARLRPATTGMFTVQMERLPLNATYQEILGVNISTVNIPVVAGRNLAVLVEAAARNFVMQQRGIDSMQEFITRHDQLLLGD